MHFLYVDESGDIGQKTGSSRFFILCGLLIHHAEWFENKDAVIALRQRMEAQFELPRHAEIHASEFLGRNDRHLNMARNIRFKCALHVMGFLRARPSIVPIRAVIDKRLAGDLCYPKAWQELLAQAARVASLPGPVGRCETHGLVIICDDHRTTPRKSLWHSLQGDGSIPVIERPFGMDSRDSQFLQLTDLLAYLSKQEIDPAKAFTGTHSRRVLRRIQPLFA